MISLDGLTEKILVILIKLFKTNRTYCFCGNSYGFYGKSNFCTAPCTGNYSEVCGGDHNTGKYAKLRLFNTFELLF